MGTREAQSISIKSDREISSETTLSPDAIPTTSSGR